MRKAFTLIEIIIVIIVVAVLAAVGISQYSLIVEKSRITEAKIRIGAIRQLAHQYWLENSDTTNIQNADVGVDYTCTSSGFYKYYVVSYTAAGVGIAADRCGSGGKTPNYSRPYRYVLIYYPGTGVCDWRCGYIDDNSSCFGLPPT